MAKKAEEKRQMESTTVFVRGILTDAFYGAKSYGNGKSNGVEKYRLSIKVVPEDMVALIEKAAPYYEKTDEQWIPKWFKDESAREYLNFTSNFDIKAGYKNAEGKIEELGNLVEYISKTGNINGSKVVVMVTIKEGAIYPASILVKEFKHTTIADMFSDFDDELPF